MPDRFETVSPADGSVCVQRRYASPEEVSPALKGAIRAQREWKRVPLDERARLVGLAVDAFVAKKDELSREIAVQMGRPVSQCPGEIRGFEDRARSMIA